MTESLVFPGPPTLTNGNDGQNYNMGIRFSLVAPQDCVGIRWERTPDNPISVPGGGQWVASIWNWDTQTLVTSVNFVPVAAQPQEILFASPVSLVNGVNYVAAIFTRDYVFRANGSNLTTSTPSGNVVADRGLLSTGTPATFPSGNQLAWYYVSPLMSTGTEPAEGAAALGLDYAVSTTGGADAEGSASAGLALALAATGRASHSAVASLELGLSVAASGSTPAQGSVALGLGLTPAASGLRRSQGVVALGLGLAVSARGSNGDSGRPVKPWPHGTEPVSSFPWTPRPVKSFQEVSTP